MQVLWFLLSLFFKCYIQPTYTRAGFDLTTHSCSLLRWHTFVKILVKKLDFETKFSTKLYAICLTILYKTQKVQKFKRTKSHKQNLQSYTDLTLINFFSANYGREKCIKLTPGRRVSWRTRPTRPSTRPRPWRWRCWRGNGPPVIDSPGSGGTLKRA
jgi:hypothetical protein